MAVDQYAAEYVQHHRNTPLQYSLSVDSIGEQVIYCLSFKHRDTHKNAPTGYIDLFYRSCQTKEIDFSESMLTPVAERALAVLQAVSDN